MTTRSARIVEAERERLNASARVRFVREATDGTLSEEAFALYLAIEERFVRTAARVAGYCLWSQPDWVVAELHARAVADLVGPQLEYFARVRGEHTAADIAEVATAVIASEVLSDHVLSTVREGGYSAAIVSMFAAETLYAGWCTDAHIVGRATGDLARWIELHTEPAFIDQVATLAGIVDGLDVDDEQALGWFGAMLDAEDGFHDSIYPGIS